MKTRIRGVKDAKERGFSSFLVLFLGVCLVVCGKKEKASLVEIL